MPRPLLFTAAAGVVPPALSPAFKGTLRRQLTLGGRSLRSLHAHLSELSGLHAALRLQSAGDGNFMAAFYDAVLPFQKTPSNCKSLHQPDQEEVNILGEDLLLDDHYDHSGAKVQNFAQTAAFGASSGRPASGGIKTL